MRYDNKLKTLEKTKDGRIIVKKACVESKPRQSIHMPNNFYVIFAYGEKCISGFEDQEEASKNMRIMANYVGPEHQMRKKYDPAVVGIFMPVIKKAFRN